MSIGYIYDNCAEKPTSWDVVSLGARAESTLFFKNQLHLSLGQQN